MTLLQSPVVRVLLVAAAAHLAFTAPAEALIMVAKGNDPVQDRDWPQGAVEVANLKSRVLYWEGPPIGGGQYQFQYQGDAAAFQEALDALAKIRAPRVELVIHDGPLHSHFLKDNKDPTADVHADWTFTVWIPASWHELFNNPRKTYAANHPNSRRPVAPPRMDVYVGGGLIDWDKIKLPKGIDITDRRAATHDVDVSKGTVVRVDVFDMTTARPVHNATLHAAPRGGNADAKTLTAKGDDDGRIELRQIPNGAYHLWIEAPGYAPRSIDSADFQTPQFYPMHTYLTAPATIRGRVVDEAGKPIAGVKVRLGQAMGVDGRGYQLPESPTDESDDQGQFAIEGVPAGYADLRAYHDGYRYPHPPELIDTPGNDVTVRMYQTGQVKVQVLDAAGNAAAKFEGKQVIVDMEPVGGSKVGSYGGGGNVKPDGTFTYKGVPPGDYVITARPNPSTTDRVYAEPQTVTVKAGETASVTVKFK